MAKISIRKRRWTEQEMDSLAVGLRPLGRTTNSVYRKRKRMGLTKARPPRPKWEASELAVLKESALKGFSASKVKEMGLLPQSKNAIQKMMCRMGLVKKLKIVRFPHEVLQRFRSFLADNWEGRTSEELSAMWTQANARSPAGRKRVVAELTRMRLKIPYGEVQRINNLRKKEEKLKRLAESKALNLSSFTDAIKAERIKFMRCRSQKGRDIWTGMKVEAEAFEQ
jgi:hypothetical protein